MSITWGNIAYTGQDNMAGHRSVRCAPIDRFSVTPDPTTRNIIELEPTFRNPGEKWITIGFTQDTAGFSEREVLGIGGPQWECRLKIFKPADSADDRAQLEDWARYRWVVDATDAQGYQRRLGSLRNPARLSMDFDVDSAATGQRGYTLEWVWRNDRPAPVVRVDEDLDGTYTAIDPGDITNPDS